MEHQGGANGLSAHANVGVCRKLCVCCYCVPCVPLVHCLYTSPKGIGVVFNCSTFSSTVQCPIGDLGVLIFDSTVTV